MAIGPWAGLWPTPLTLVADSARLGTSFRYPFEENCLLTSPAQCQFVLLHGSSPAAAWRGRSTRGADAGIAAAAASSADSGVREPSRGRLQGRDDHGRPHDVPGHPLHARRTVRNQMLRRARDLSERRFRDLMKNIPTPEARVDHIAASAAARGRIRVTLTLGALPASGARATRTSQGNLKVLTSKGDIAGEAG